MSTELQGFHYKIRRYNSAQEHSQKTQFPIHPNSFSPTRQENTILSSYATARLLGIISNYFYFVLHITTYIYICVCVCVCVLLAKSTRAFPLQLGFYQLTLTWAWQFKPHTAHFNIDKGLYIFATDWDTKKISSSGAIMTMTN